MLEIKALQLGHNTIALCIFTLFLHLLPHLFLIFLLLLCLILLLPFLLILSLCFPVDDKWLSTGGSGDDCGVGYGGACSQFAWCQMVEEGLRCVCRPGFSGNGLECSGDHCVSESGRTPLPPLRVGPLHQYTDSRFILLYRAGTLMSLC